MIISTYDNLTVFQSAIVQTNVAVLDTPEFVLVTDPAWVPQEVEEIAQHVEAIQRNKPTYLLFTHSHFDHILGAGAFPDAITIASQAFIDNPDKEVTLRYLREWDDERLLQRPYEARYPEIDIAIDEDGHVLTLGETRLTFYSAPGHNPDGLSTVIEPQGILIAGDYFSDILCPNIYQSSIAYEATLRKLDLILEKHAVNLLISGHGSVATDHREMRRRQQESLAYIDALREHIAAGNQTALDAMPASYAASDESRFLHEGNQTIVRTEMGANTSLELSEQ